MNHYDMAEYVEPDIKSNDLDQDYELHEAQIKRSGAVVTQVMGLIPQKYKLYEAYEQHWVLL